MIVGHVPRLTKRRRNSSVGKSAVLYYWPTYLFLTGSNPARDKIFIWKNSPSECMCSFSRGGFTGISRECRDMSWLSSTSGSPARNTQQWGWRSIPNYIHRSDGHCRKLPASVKRCELTFLFNNLHWGNRRKYKKISNSIILFMNVIFFSCYV